MTKTDWLLLALNASATLLSVLLAIEFMTYEPRAHVSLLLIPPLAIIANSVVLLRRSERGQATASRGMERADELDARTVLDLDARLEALEQAQHDAVDAARWRALVESGQVTAPASDPPAAAASGARAASRNGL